MNDRASLARGVRSVVLVDDDVGGDRRVSRALEQAPAPALVVDLREADDAPSLIRIWDGARAALLMVGCLKGGRARQRELADWLKPSAGMAAGLWGCWRWTRRALTASRKLEFVLAREPVELVYANDLAAGLVLGLASAPRNVRRVYDSHELQIHRHRRAGWLRVLIEQDQERRALTAADDVVTVNSAVASAMRRIHPQLSAAPRVVSNDFYTHREIVSAPASATPALLYVGRGTRGRQVERLLGTPQQLGFEVRGWLLDTTPPDAWRPSFRRSDGDYEPEVRQTMLERRCLMWCCMETQALNNRLATPNKFFQALALGLPVVVSPDTYLAELVERYEIGAIDHGNLPALAELARTERYQLWLANLQSFREKLRARPESAL